MLQDSFQIYKKGKDFYLLRILNRVDFAMEVVWARSFKVGGNSKFKNICLPLIEYLAEGFDSICTWPKDEEGWHMNIGHLGFDLILETQLLAGAYLNFERADPSVDPFLQCLFLRLSKSGVMPIDRQIPSYAGNIYEVLKKRGFGNHKPKDLKALVSIPFGLILEKDFPALDQLLQAYC